MTADVTEQLRQRASRKADASPARSKPRMNGSQRGHSLFAVESHVVDFTPLDARRIDLANPPPKPVPILMLNGHQVSTAGNLTVIAAQAKAGKSATIGAILASLIVSATENDSADCFGFEGQPHDGKAVILFDTEQSGYDSFRLVSRAAQRGGVAAMPSNFRLYRVLDLPTAQRRTYLRAEMERASKECRGVHCVLIDGVADLCIDPNDSPESFGLVEELVQLAVEHDCPMIVVLHENPSQQQSVNKTRGHLGSQLERKAESNLRVVKSGDVSTIYSDKCRSAHIPKDRGACFAWSETAGMHIAFAKTNGVEGKKARKKEEQQAACDSVFEGVKGAIAWSELLQRLMTRAMEKRSTAERRISEWANLGLVTKGPDGYQKT